MGEGGEPEEVLDDLLGVAAGEAALPDALVVLVARPSPELEQALQDVGHLHVAGEVRRC